MAEICTKPLNITIGDVEYAAFSEHHSLADIVRWLMENPVDAEEVHRMLSEALWHDLS